MRKVISNVCFTIAIVALVIEMTYASYLMPMVWINTILPSIIAIFAISGVWIR